VYTSAEIGQLGLLACEFHGFGPFEKWLIQIDFTPQLAFLGKWGSKVYPPVMTI
jgi:hypothetical protein